MYTIGGLHIFRLLILLTLLTFALTPNQSLLAQLGPETCDDGIDNDGDFLVDYEDPDCDNSDDDGDGIADDAEGDRTVDTDGDGSPDSRDEDSDNDGVADSVEGHDLNGDGQPDRLPSGVDIDNNGLDDAYDPGQGGVVAPLPDHDQDGLADFRDPDDDGDQVASRAEDVDGNGNPANDDSDGDQTPNYLDDDDDNDGLPTQQEDANGDGNPSNEDGNGDGIPDFRQPNDQVTGIVWKDQNGDGLRALSDPFMPEITVVLMTAGQNANLRGYNQAIITTTTSITGWYHLVSPVAGSYALEFTPPSNLLPTFANQGNNEAADSDVLPMGQSSLGRSISLTQSYSGQITAIDAGFLTPATLTVYIFNDLSRDGKRQAGEGLVGGATVLVLDANGDEVMRGDANNSGTVVFTPLLPGAYRLEIMPPETYQVDVTKLPAVPLLKTRDDIRLEAPIFHSPNAATLVAFTATVATNMLHIQWATAAELYTQGYHLFLGADEIFAHAAQITAELIPGQGSAGGTYTVTMPYDPRYAPPISLLHLWLVEQEATGQQNRYGPIRVKQTRLFLPIMRE